MNRGKICVSICGGSAEEVMAEISRVGDAADVIEVRFDCLAPDQIKPLAERLGTVDRTLLLTFRPREEGGRRDLTAGERAEFWDYILRQLEGLDLIVDRESDIQLPISLPDDQVIVSLHDFRSPPADLLSRFESLAGATTLKIAITAARITDALDVWSLFEVAKRSGKRAIPIAMGEAGKWTRILGLAHGSPMTYASTGTGRETAPGQISAADLRNVFRVGELDRNTDVYGVIAGDTSYSLSPYMHNAAFREKSLNAVFVPLQTDDLDLFIRRMVRPGSREVELNFRGFSVTNPHKQSVIQHLDHIDETAEKIGAVNTVKIDGDRFYGFNTDAEGFITPLEKTLGDVRGSRVAVVGAGGAARACVYALSQKGALVTLLARDVAKASALAHEFGVQVEQLTTYHRPFATDILVNATPAGTRGEQENETIATAEELRGVKLVYDLVYNPSQTRLTGEAVMAGAKTLGGLDMLIAQGATQFEIWTGRAAPLDTMRSVIEAHLNYG